MFRAAVRQMPRQSLIGLSPSIAHLPRRYASTKVPADKSRSWKSLAARWSLAFGAVLYYNTSPVFAEEASSSSAPPQPAYNTTDLPTVDSVIEEKRAQLSQKTPNPLKDDQKPNPPKDEAPAGEEGRNGAVTESSSQVLEEEAGQEGAFNPETGEINWDCPCLGGMAHGPCGEEFKTAFSCFVFSTDEPKGMDCIDKFQHMQDCFRKYPDVYGAELSDDDDRPGEEADAQHSPAKDDSAAQQHGDADTSATARPEASKTLAENEVSNSVTPRFEDARDANDVVLKDQGDESKRSASASSEKNSDS